MVMLDRKRLRRALPLLLSQPRVNIHDGFLAFLSLLPHVRFILGTLRLQLHLFTLLCGLELLEFARTLPVVVSDTTFKGPHLAIIL